MVFKQKGTFASAFFALLLDILIQFLAHVSYNQIDRQPHHQVCGDENPRKYRYHFPRKRNPTIDQIGPDVNGVQASKVYAHALGNRPPLYLVKHTRPCLHKRQHVGG